MTAQFVDITARNDHKEVILNSKNGKYYCESDKHVIEEVEFKTYLCKSCRKLYMGPTF